MVAHRQGFNSLDEIDRAVIEPGGTITLLGRNPNPEIGRHQELLARLDQITKELAELRRPESTPILTDRLCNLKKNDNRL